MTISKADVLALQEQISADRKKLEQREQALRIVAEMLSENEALTTTPAKASAPAYELLIESGVPLPAESFTQMVRDAVFDLKGEFTTSDVDSLVRQRGAPLPRKPRSMISMILADLVAKQKITLARPGSGRTPHRYRLVNSNGAGD